MKEEQRDEGKQDTQQYDSFLYKFQQQIVDAWKPVPHTSSNVILYAALSAISITIGLILIETTSTSQEIFLRYDNVNVCSTSKSSNDNSPNSSCKVAFTLNRPLTAPVYFYYGFKGFYQNHRRYIKYFSNAQLTSGDPWATGADKDCSDLYTNFQTFGNNVSSIAGNGSILLNNDPAYPCGTISRMYYQLRDEIQGFRLYDKSKVNIPISQTGIAWPSDLGMHVDAPDRQMAFRVTEQTWLVWFRPAAESNFYKLNGIIRQDLPAGNYSISFKNQVTPTWGEKWISLSKSTYQGNRDPFLGIAFLILGGVCIIILIFFLIRLVMEKKRLQEHSH